jgi:hypothetical protein
MKHYKKKSYNPAMHVIECSDCGAVLASASERNLLPQFATCDCEEEFFEEDNGPTGHGDICYSDADPGL